MSDDRKTFAEIVNETKAAPRPEPEPVVGFTKDGRIQSPAGVTYDRHADSITPERALEAASAGATVAWDPCGCGGGCGLTWFDDADRSRLVGAGAPRISPRKKDRSGIDEWRSEDGHVLLVANNFVWWSDLLAN